MEIKSARFIISNTDSGKCPQHDKPEYAFIGRSNVGKSSLINMITGRKGLAMTSSTPGKTILINHFLINDDWYLVDLPGYGYAQRGQAQREQLKNMIESYVLYREQLTSLFVLIDSRLEPQKIDVEFINHLGEEGVPFALIFTKADKSSRSRLNNNVKRFLDNMSEDWEELPPYFVTSSIDRTGRDELLSYIEQTNKSIRV
jgi:GTP-binding protein